MVRGMVFAKALYALGVILNPPLARAVDRGKRGHTLEPWGLHPHRADPGTPMALDDMDGFDSKIPEGVCGTVLFPIMNATDALASIQILLRSGAGSIPFKHHTSSFLSMCRTAFESSAQAIWILSPEDRESRRARAADLARIGIEHARDYHKEAINAHDNKLMMRPDELYGQSKHRYNFHQDELAVLGTLPLRGKGYPAMVRKAANWLEAHPPAHTTDMQGKHFPTIMKQQYRLCSSLPTDIRGRRP
jgi:hypothetical protein